MVSQLPIGEWLIQHGHIDDVQLQRALDQQRRSGGFVGEILIDLGVVSERAVLAEVAYRLSVPYADLRGAHVPPATVRLIPERIIRTRRVFPLALKRSVVRAAIVMATSEPQDLALLDAVGFATGRPIEPVLASRRSLDDVIARHLDHASAHADIEIVRPSAPLPRGDAQRATAARARLRWAEQLASQRTAGAPSRLLALPATT